MAARTIPLKPCSPGLLTTSHTSRWHFSFFSPSHQFLRRLHRSSQLSVPPPTPFVPDTQTFLSLIGRNMSRFAPKFASWGRAIHPLLRRLEGPGASKPARLRRYLLRWRQKFHRGEYGVGGDFTPTATDGGLGQREIPPFTVTGTATLSPGMKWAVPNLLPDEPQPTEVLQPLKKYTKVSLLIKGSNAMAGILKVHFVPQLDYYYYVDAYKHTDEEKRKV
ncbi:conserved hypothetical protein [Histoplasma capsulatum var. duboisii H88]|uniref:Small ribosomal subunit protein mS41 n=1 Tax=Ajellomyces capsulatus (strain H88) TaxID=544711 RepID=F0UW58_AJEC8|nr:conserved hypothetical protein [Histoplasma capsulatum var. duboisii H88]